MHPLSNKEVYDVLINSENTENNDFLQSILDYLKIVVKNSHIIPMNEFRKSNKFKANLFELAIVSNTGDESMLCIQDKNIIKTIKM